MHAIFCKHHFKLNSSAFNYWFFVASKCAYIRVCFTLDGCDLSAFGIPMRAVSAKGGYQAVNGWYVYLISKCCPLPLPAEGCGVTAWPTGVGCMDARQGHHVPPAVWEAFRWLWGEQLLCGVSVGHPAWACAGFQGRVGIKLGA